MLATILLVVLLAGCGGEEEELTAPTEETETDEDTTEVTQAPPEGGVFFAIRCSWLRRGRFLVGKRRRLLMDRHARATFVRFLRAIQEARR